MKRFFTRVFTSVLALALALIACSSASVSTETVQDNGPLRLVADPSIQILEKNGILSSCGVDYTVQYLGSVEMKLRVQAYSKNNPGDVDVFWAASPTWLPGSFVVNKTPIMGTYVVFGVDPLIAREFGWKAGDGIGLADIMRAVRSDKLSLAMASSSQDDAAANFYLATLTALKGDGSPLFAEDLENPAITGPMKEFYGSVKAGSNHSGELAQNFIADRLSGNAQFNSFVLPESMAIAVNQELATKNAAPMLLFYVNDAVGLESFTIGYTKEVSPEKQKDFGALISCLTSTAVQVKLQSLGFRTGSVGMKVENPDTKVFNPAWGVNGMTEYVTVSLPKPPVIEAALNVYQSSLRKSSCTVYDLDFSPSMEDGPGMDQLLSAMNLLLDQTRASQYLLQTGPYDTTAAVLFSGYIHNQDNVGNIFGDFIIQGNDPGGLLGLYGRIEDQDVGSATNIYGSAIRSLQLVGEICRQDQLPAVILLTDGKHNYGSGYNELEAYYRGSNLHVPIFAIEMGSASPDDLQRIVDLANGRLCDGRNGEDSLVRCFRDFRGSN